MIKDKFKLNTPLPDIFDRSWTTEGVPQDYVAFRNLDHFRHSVDGITQRDDDICGLSYKDALGKLLRGESDFPVTEQESIRNLVRENLHKRGLITSEVYESYKYDVEGTGLGFDVGKYAAGEPDCVITPTHKYVDFFYELYISINYPYTVTDESVRKTVAKLLATIEELERRHIYIKVTLVLALRNVNKTGNHNFFSSIPLFSHNAAKSVATMSATVNERLLRKFYFAILEDLYGDELARGHGYPQSLKGVINAGEELNEIDLYKSIVESVGAQEL